VTEPAGSDDDGYWAENQIVDFAEAGAGVRPASATPR